MSSRKVCDNKQNPREESDEELVSDNASDVEVKSFARSRRRTNKQAATPGDPTEISREESREVETPEKSKKDDKDNKDGKKKADEDKKKGTPKVPKMKWTEENNRQLLLIMLSPNMVPNKHKGAIAKTFRENPSDKAVQEQMAKLREASRALLKATKLDKEFSDAESKGKKGATSCGGPFGTKDEPAPGTPTTTTSSTGPITSSSTPIPVINNGDEIFDGFSLTWGDLSEDVRKHVRNACDRRKQKLDRDAQVPGWTKMHERNYQKQLAREVEKEKKIEEAKGGASTEQITTKKPGTQLERQTEKAKMAEKERAKQDEGLTMIELSKSGKETASSSTEQTSKKKSQTEMERELRERADMIAQLTGSRPMEKAAEGGHPAEEDEEMNDAPAEG